MLQQIHQHQVQLQHRHRQDADLVGTAQLDSQANGWCGNDDCTNVKADIKGAGTYTVSSTWEEVQEDPQAYCALTIADLKDIAAYVTFKDVTVWVDGKVVNMPVVYGGDKDCRIQLWNTWGNDGVGAGFEVPANFPSSFYEIKVQFTIGLRDTARDWDAEGTDSSLINIDTIMSQQISLLSQHLHQQIQHQLQQQSLLQQRMQLNHLKLQRRQFL